MEIEKFPNIYNNKNKSKINSATSNENADNNWKEIFFKLKLTQEEYSFLMKEKAKKIKLY